MAYNYTINSHLINEFRGGYNATRTALDANVNSATLINQVGITGIPDIATVPTVPDFQIVGLRTDRRAQHAPISKARLSSYWTI